MPTPTQRNYSSTAVQQTLTSAITTTATTIGVSGTTGMPAVPFVVALDYGGAAEELVQVTAISGLNLTVTRSFNGTTAQAHSSGAIVQHVHSAQDFTDFSQHLFATNAVHGISGNVVGTNDTQSLTNKNLSDSSNIFPGIFVTTTGAQTLTNKTLTSPDVNQINDTNNNEIVGFLPASSAVNFVSVANAATTVAPSIVTTGTDTNIGLGINTKGTGQVTINGVVAADVNSTQTLANKTLTTAGINTLTAAGATTGAAPTITAAGGDANVGLSLITKGTGLLKAQQNGAASLMNLITASATATSDSSLSSLIQSYTNTGAGGGTFYYVNLGGLKVVWGVTNTTVLAAGAGFSGNISLPTSFFTQAPTAIVSAVGAGTSKAAVGGTVTTSTVPTWVGNDYSGSQNLAVSAIIIGV